MQKRLKASIWPEQVKKPEAQPQISPLEKLEQLRSLMPQAGYIRQAGLIPGIIPISAATLWRWVKAGEFPPPVKLSARVTGWRVDDVRAWLEMIGTHRAMR